MLSYIYTLNLLVIMLAYCFVPLILNNPYRLFCVSSGHNSVTVRCWTYVYSNFFNEKDLRYYLVQ
jgi:cytochrome c oxidase assembly protein Cox11